MGQFTSSDKIIDVRGVIARVEELREEREALVEAVSEACLAREKHTALEYLAEMHHEAMKEELDWREENKDELQELESLLEDLCSNGGDEQWEGNWYPVTLIHEDEFESYMDEMLEDCGGIPKNLPSYLTITVDYDALQQDYSSVEFDGATYWYR